MKQLIAMAIALALAGNAAADKRPLYKDPKAPVADRVEDLLQRMTLDEKVGQMNQLVGLRHMQSNAEMSEADLAKNTANAFYPGWTVKAIEDMTRQGLVSSFLHVLTMEEANELQRLNMQSRLQIPLLIGIDAIHGNAKCEGNTVYPTNIGLACSFDTAMAYTIARQTAREMRAMNMQWTFNPNVEVQRDGRWGRSGETFGEDPFLVGLLGEATTRGYQGNMDNPQTDVLACVKHFVGGSAGINGTNGSPCDVSLRTLREVFFPPFARNIAAGAGSMMVSHNELNGIPCHSNRWLMEDIARKEMGFQGFVVSDWDDIEHLVDQHHTAPDRKDAFRQAILAGIDMHMHGPEWQREVVELVNEGKVPMSRIDQAVRRILTAKFRLGLFEHPYATAKERDKAINDPAHKATALQAARNSIVLLRNEGGLLPLEAKQYNNVLVTGINADDQNIMGDWSEPQPADKVWTVLRGLREAQPQTRFDFVDQGWDPRNMSQAKVDEAVEKAAKSDLNIVVCGEYMMRFRWNDRTSGEDTDRDNLDLVGLQDQLIERIAATGKPMVLVVVSGRPLSLRYAAQHVPAILYAWEPGQFGGKAIADILYGAENPSARLAMTIPRSVGQIATYYNHKASAYFHPVVCGDSQPLWAFGEGLSYTTFRYSALNVRPDGDGFTATVTIDNTGKRDGVSIAQMYIRDCVSSVARPVKELKGFRRVALRAGESRTVSFHIAPDALAFYDIDMKPRVEPGDYEVQIGTSSKDCDLLKAKFTLQ